MLASSVRVAMRNLVEGSEDYLMERILAYARERGYARYTSTLREAWRLSISGLSAAITGALDQEGLQLELSPDDDLSGDPICAFAVKEAVAHRTRGVTLPMFLGLFKYYRQSYLDMVLERAPCTTQDKMAMLRFLDRAFDRMEIAYCKEWSGAGTDALMEELQQRNRLITNEKNAYLTVFESLTDPVILVDHETTIVDLNLAAAKLLDPKIQPGQLYYGFGAERGEGTRHNPWLGKPLKQHFPWLHSRLGQVPPESALELNVELAGVPRHFQLRVSRMLDVSGKFSATVLLLQDVGPLKEAQELRRSVEVRMLELRRQEGLAAMAGGIAHDFNNMLAAIVGNVSLIQEQLPGESPVLDQIKQIQRTALSASELSSQMLAYSGGAHMRLGPLDLNEELERNARLIQSTVTARFPVRLGLARNLPLVLGDGRQLRQLLMELCVNAQEAYGGRDGVIGVRSYLAELGQRDLESMRIGSERQPGTFVALEVSDHGEGMTPEVLARAFDPFFTTRMTGRGLGLAAVFGIVRGHGGALKVKSSREDGTSLTVYLQVAQAPDAAEAVRVEAPKAGLAGNRILLVDDEQTVAFVFSRLLALKGFSVQVAKDGDDAMQKIQEQGPFDLVLSDWTMPGLSGARFLEAVRRALPGVPVVIMSGYAEEALDTGGLEVPFIHKPFSLGDLMAFLERLGFSKPG